jgi:hypothetical protein
MGTSVNFATHLMATFTSRQQEQHRQTFLEDCRQKAWGAACNADYVGVQHDRLMADYEKLQNEDADLEAQIKALDSALDYHTKGNREKRRILQERRNTVTKQKDALLGTAVQLQQGMRQLYANFENNLILAKHAEAWEWKEVETPPPSTA